MSKLRLVLDEIAVDTFEAGEAPVPGRGTVDAHAATEKLGCSLLSAKTNLTCCPCTPMI